MPLVFLVDDDTGSRSTIGILLEAAGYQVKAHESAESCLSDDLSEARCLISDIRMPQMSGLELLEELNRRGTTSPVMFITGHGDVSLAVHAMQSGAVDFLEKPFDTRALLRSVERSVALAESRHRELNEMSVSRALLTLLTPREQQVLELLVSGQTHKAAARTLGMSYRTVEVHRANIMRKLCARGLSDLVRIALFGAAIPGAVKNTHTIARYRNTLK